MADPTKIGIPEGRCDGGCTFWDCGRPAGHAGPCAPPDRPTERTARTAADEPARPGQETCGDCVCSPEQAPTQDKDRTVTALEELLTPGTLSTRPAIGFVLDIFSPGCWVVDSRPASPLYGQRIAGPFGNEAAAERWIEVAARGADREARRSLAESIAAWLSTPEGAAL